MTQVGRWLNGLEYLLLLQSTPLQFLAFIRSTVTGGSGALFWPRREPHAYVVHT